MIAFTGSIAGRRGRQVGVGGCPAQPLPDGNQGLVQVAPAPVDLPDSRAAKGTTMTLVLTEPSVDDFVKALTSAPIAAPATPTILIADDDDDIRDVIAFKLQVCGFRTLSADNGRTALSLAVEQQPRMIILDETLPKMDGLSVCHELHARRETA